MEISFTNSSQKNFSASIPLLEIQSSYKEIFKEMKTYALILILFFGVVGNLLNLIIFGKKNMRKVSTFRFLFYLSFIDFLVLLVGATDMLTRNVFEFEIRIYSNFWCKFHTYFTYTITHMSSILLIIISIHRATKMLKIKPHNCLATNKGDQLSIAVEVNTIDMNTVGMKTFEKSSKRLKISKIIYDTELSKNEISNSQYSYNRKENKKISKKKTKMIKSSNNSNETAEKSSKIYKKNSDEEFSSKTDDYSEFIPVTLSTTPKVSFKIPRNENTTKITENSLTKKFLNEDIQKVQSTPNYLEAKSNDYKATIKPESELKKRSALREWIVKSFDTISSFISTDILILISLISIALMNLHFLFFLNVYKIDFLDFLSTSIKSEEDIGDGFRLFLGETNFFNLKKCFAKSGTFYEQFLKTKWFLIDMSIFSLLPLISMIGSSLIIWMKFKKINEKYSRFITTESYNQHNKLIYFRKIKRNRQICLIILNSSAYFFFSMGVYWICFLLLRNSVTQNEFFNELQSFVYILLYTNNAFDFVIYGFSSSTYRVEFYKTFNIRKQSHFRSFTYWISSFF
jgi:hypothetical protein